ADLWSPDSWERLGELVASAWGCGIDEPACAGVVGRASDCSRCDLLREVLPAARGMGLFRALYRSQVFVGGAVYRGWVWFDLWCLSVRVSLVDSDHCLLASAVAEYPLHRKREDPEFATQSHADHMKALAAATQEVLQKAGVGGDRVCSMALDTTGSSVLPV